LVPLSSEHHQALVLCLRIDRELPRASDDEVQTLYEHTIHLWSRGLIPHFGAESDCLLARLVRLVAPEHPDARRSQARHLPVASLNADMTDARSTHARRASRRDLATVLRGHVRWEEATYSPLVETELTGDELDAVSRELATRLPKAPPTAFGTGGFP